MKYKTTLFYLIAAVLLISLYLYDVRREKEKQEAEEKARSVLQIAPDRINGLTLERGDERIEMRKTGDEVKTVWRITFPVRTVAMTFVVEEITEKLAGLKFSRIISEKADDLSPFGLEPAALVLTYTTPQGSDTLSIGAKSPTGDGYYARLGDQKRVFLIETWDRDTLDKDLFDLRVKTLFTFYLDDVTRFVFVRETDTWPLIKKGEAWFFEDDERFNVDSLKVNSLLIKYTRAKAASFVDEDPKELEGYGLHAPGVKVILSDGSKSQTLLFGDPVKGDPHKIYAMRAGKPPVVTLHRYLVDDFPKRRDALEKKEEEEVKKNRE